MKDDDGLGLALKIVLGVLLGLCLIGCLVVGGLTMLGNSLNQMFDDVADTVGHEG